MTKKRKRSHKENSSLYSPKRQKSEESSHVSNNVLLSLYYPKVSTLRAYILSCFPDSSKSRKHRIKSVPRWQGHRLAHDHSFSEIVAERPNNKTTLSENRLISKLLDTTVVGHGLESKTASSVLPRKQDLDSLHLSLRSSAGSADVTQHEVRFRLALRTSYVFPLIDASLLLISFQAYQFCGWPSILHCLSEHNTATTCTLQRVRNTRPCPL